MAQTHGGAVVHQVHNLLLQNEIAGAAEVVARAADIAKSRVIALCALAAASGEASDNPSPRRMCQLLAALAARPATVNFVKAQLGAPETLLALGFSPKAFNRKTYVYYCFYCPRTNHSSLNVCSHRASTRVQVH